MKIQVRNPMPRFTWQAIGLDGKIYTGTMSARTMQELDIFLLQQELALLKAYYHTSRGWKPISRSLQSNFFKELSLLLNSGICIDNALHLLVEQISDKSFREIVWELYADVQEGTYLHNAMKKHTECFDELTIQMVTAGHHAGQLAQSLEQLHEHQELMQSFIKKIRQATLVPCITFLFFITVALIIFLFVVPAFTDMFSMTGQALPYATSIILSISIFLRSWIAYTGIIALMAIATAIFYIIRRSYTKQWDRFLLILPGIGTLCCIINVTYFLQALALLIEKHVHIVTALECATQTINNQFIKSHIEAIIPLVNHGTSLSTALARSNLFSVEIPAMIRIGEESGHLGTIIARACHIYRNRVIQTLSTLTTLIYPLLMIIMGLLVTLLIFCVYLPLFNLSYSIS